MNRMNLKFLNLSPHFSSGCLEEHWNLLVNREWLTDAFSLIQTTLLNPYVNAAMQILANMSRKGGCVIGDKLIDPYGCVLGILYLISEEGDGYSPFTDTS